MFYFKSGRFRNHFRVFLYKEVYFLLPLHTWFGTCAGTRGCLSCHHRNISLFACIIGIFSTFWVAGFDIIYSLQDDNFDRNHNLQSIPAKLGRKGALLVSRILHLSSIIIIILFTWYSSSLFTQLDYILYIGTAVFISMLVYQHSLVKENDLRRVGVAFLHSTELQA